MNRRQRRVAELLHQEISQLLEHHTRDPRLGFITVTGVKVSPDLEMAWVYIVVPDKDEVKRTMKGLGSAASYLRHELGQKMTLRRVPRLLFQLDTSLAYGQRIEELLDKIEIEEKSVESEL